jgi:hypothetical protein
MTRTRTHPRNRSIGRRDQQKLGLLVNENRRVALDEIPPNDIVGPLLIAGHE